MNKFLLFFVVAFSIITQSVQAQSTLAPQDKSLNEVKAVIKTETLSLKMVW